MSTTRRNNQQIAAEVAAAVQAGLAGQLPGVIPKYEQPIETPREYFEKLVATLPPSPDSLVSIEGELNSKGIKVLRNASGVAGKIELANGQIVDVIKGAGAGGFAWQWLTDEGWNDGVATAAIAEAITELTNVAVEWALEVADANPPTSRRGVPTGVGGQDPDGGAEKGRLDGKLGSAFPT